MSKQKKISNFSFLKKDHDKIALVLDLEKDYFDLLWETFTSDEFINSLLFIENDIKNNYENLQKIWDLKNKLKIPAERLTRHHIYKNLSNKILDIYPSPISSDIAFITNDAVVNIDIKTIDICGNSSDIKNLQFENNQSSFINKNLDEDEYLINSGVKVETQLPQEYYDHQKNSKIVLTYFLTIIYEDNKKSFNLSRNDEYGTIILKCLPNGILSPLFENDIVSNFKTYSYLTKKDGFEPIYLTNNKEKIEEEIKKFVDKNSSKYTLIRGRSKMGVFSHSEKHPYYKTNGVSLFSVFRKGKLDKDPKFFLEAVKCGNTIRTSNKTIKERYDSNDNLWLGVKKFTL